MKPEKDLHRNAMFLFTILSVFSYFNQGYDESIE